MNAFEYVRPATIDAALAAGRLRDVRFIAGGTNLVDLMKAGVEAPAQLIDVNHLGLDQIELRDGVLYIGAAARNSDVANHALVRANYPLLTQALLAGASPQLRNMATIGGNLMQRTRCDYFVDTAYVQCNKRKPGSGCAALHGYNRGHAILGASEACVAVNPSDMNVALLALGASVRVRGAAGERSIAIDQFHRLPGDHPERDTNLQVGELIVGIDLPATNFRNHFAYVKVRDRASYAFALVSVAAALDVVDGKVQAVALALGGVAHKPWLASDAAKSLVGVRLQDADFDHVAAAALVGALPLEHNAFKIPMARRAIAQALKQAAEVV